MVTGFVRLGAAPVGEEPAPCAGRGLRRSCALSTAYVGRPKVAGLPRECGGGRAVKPKRWDAHLLFFRVGGGGKAGLLSSKLKRKPGWAAPISAHHAPRAGGPRPLTPPATARISHAPPRPCRSCPVPAQQRINPPIWGMQRETARGRGARSASYGCAAPSRRAPSTFVFSARTLIPFWRACAGRVGFDRAKQPLFR